MCKKLFSFGLLLFILFIFQTQKTFACVCDEDSPSVEDSPSLDKRVANDVKRADAIFSGKIIAVQYREMSKKEISESGISPIDGKNIFGGKTNLKILTIKIKVNHWWKGYRAREVTLLTNTYKGSNGFTATTSCELDVREKEIMLVFAYGKDLKHLQTSYCSARLLKDKSDYLKILGKGRIPK